MAETDLDRLISAVDALNRMGGESMRHVTEPARTQLNQLVEEFHGWLKPGPNGEPF